MHVSETKADLIASNGQAYATLRGEVSNLQRSHPQFTSPGSAANVAMASTAHGIVLFLTWVDQAPAAPGKNRGSRPEKWSSHDAYQTELNRQLSKFRTMSWEACQKALATSQNDLVHFLEARHERELYAITSRKQKTMGFTLAHWSEVVGTRAYATAARQIKMLTLDMKYY